MLQLLGQVIWKGTNLPPLQSTEEWREQRHILPSFYAFSFLLKSTFCSSIRADGSCLLVLTGDLRERTVYTPSCPNILPKVLQPGLLPYKCGGFLFLFWRGLHGKSEWAAQTSGTLLQNSWAQRGVLFSTLRNNELELSWFSCCSLILHPGCYLSCSYIRGKAQKIF